MSIPKNQFYFYASFLAPGLRWLGVPNHLHNLIAHHGALVLACIPFQKAEHARLISDQITAGVVEIAGSDELVTTIESFLHGVSPLLLMDTL
jgi:hypothetical protein